MANYVSNFDLKQEDGSNINVLVRDSSAQNLIAQEITNREQADTALQNNIDAEATARKALIDTDTDGNTVVTATKNLNVNVTGNREVMIGGDNNEDVTGNSEENYAGTHTVYEHGTSNVHAFGNKTVQVDDELSINTGKPIKYGKPVTLTPELSTVSYTDSDGNPYNVLVEGKHLNALSLGIKQNDETAGSDNVNLLNEALATGHVVYFPNGYYYFNGTIHLNHVICGIEGQSMRGTEFIFTGTGDGILVDLDYKADGMINDVYCMFTLRNFAMYGTYTNSLISESGAGLHIRNYTFEVTSGGDLSKYAEIKGDQYALELRNSVFENLYIVGFFNGIESSWELAYGLIRNCFIETCANWGIINKLSDSVYDNIVITFCYCGLWEYSSANMFSNIRINECGYRRSYRSNYTIPNSIGLQCLNSARDQFTNIEIEECYAYGAIINKCSFMSFYNLVADANGTKVNENEMHRQGAQIIESNHIVGNIFATNKNEELTQTMGLYVDDTSTDISIDYKEEKQVTPVYTNTPSTIASLGNTFFDRYKKITIDDTQGANNFVHYDGHKIDIQLNFIPSANINPGTEIADFTELFENTPSGATFNRGYLEFSGTNMTDLTATKYYVLDAVKLYANSTYKAGQHYVAYFTFLPYINL